MDNYFIPRAHARRCYRSLRVQLYHLSSRPISELSYHCETARIKNEHPGYTTWPVLVKRHDKSDDRKKSRAASLVHVNDIHACGNYTSRVPTTNWRGKRIYKRKTERGKRPAFVCGLDVDFSMAAADTERPLCENVSSPVHESSKDKKYTNFVRVTFTFTISLSFSLCKHSVE